MVQSSKLFTEWNEKLILCELDDKDLPSVLGIPI